MICPKCTRQIPDDSVLCCYCGKKLIREKRTGKRTNSTGSVYYDSRSKRWIAQVIVGKHYTENMKIRFEYKRRYFKSTTDALKALNDMEPEKVRPEFTISYYYTAFMAGRGAKLSASKQTAYKIAYNRLKTLWSRPVRELTINDLQAVLNASCESYYTAHDVRTLLNLIYRLAAADDRNINHVLPHLLELPKNEETQVEPFTEEEKLQLWYSYESGNMNAAIPLIMIYTGLMTGELRKLTKSMVHLDEKLISNNVGLKTEERKKKAVLLPDDIVPVLDDVISKAETDLLFPYCKETFYKHYYDALQTAGITRKLSPYSCRHTTATVLAVHDNVAPQVLQRVMRWKSTRMMDRYVTPDDSDARKAVNKI